MCPAPPDIMNASWTGSDYSYGNAVTYSCQTGFSVTEGNTDRQCSFGQVWAGVDIVCTG